MPIKERILQELKHAPKSFKQLKLKFKATKKFFSAMDELYSQGLINEVNGVIYLNKNNLQQEKPKRDPNVLEGELVKLTEKFGFVRVEGYEKDFFVAGRLLMGAIPGDVVLIKKVKGPKGDVEGEVVDFVKENNNIAAVIEIENGRAYAKLKDCPTVIMPVGKNNLDLKQDDVVIVAVNNRGKGHRYLTANITKVIGEINSTTQAVDLLIAQKKVNTVFSKEVAREATKNSKNIDFEQEVAYRRDLRAENIFTIDSDKTKDIDDGISIKKTENGYILGVHIADVSHFVTPKSLCDEQAYQRGTSIYFGDSVIPMLPKEYSNGVCSLNPNVVRLAFSCDIHLDKTGTVTSYEFYKSIIKSKVKGVYVEINSIFAGVATAEIKDKYEFLNTELLLLKELYELLDIKRKQRGSMNIQSDEAYIIFDEHKNPVDIQKRTRGLSEMMIEEFMLLANNCSANYAKKHKLPFLYRVHEEPAVEKLELLKSNLDRFGFKIKKDRKLQQELSDLLDKTRDTKMQQFVHMGVLRCQSKARYSTDALGHFGLSLEDYSHFTSPIRRYPDLAIHRILTDSVAGMSSEKITKKYQKFALKSAEQSSQCEVTAMQIERDATDIYKAGIMQKYIGETFEGTVTSITNFGIYVALENTVEGLVHVSNLGLINPYVTEGFSVSCAISGKKYVIGDEIKVIVTNCDIVNGNIDFAVEGIKPTQKREVVTKLTTRPRYDKAPRERDMPRRDKSKTKHRDDTKENKPYHSTRRKSKK